MNYLYLLLESFVVFIFLYLFNKRGKKEGLFIYIGFMASLLSVVMFKLINIISFPINFGLPIVMGIFTANNIIIQRYGLDEVKKIISYFGICYVSTIAIICLCSFVNSNEYDVITNNAFNNIFGYNLINVRIFIGELLSMGFMLWYNGEVYYYIRKNKNSLLFSNIGSMLVIQFIESLIFIIISYSGIYDIIMLFGMIVVRYLIKVLIGVVGLVPVMLVNRVKGK